MKTDLVDLTPTSSNPRDIKKHRTMLPKRSPLNIVDEAHCGEIHVGLAFSLDDVGFGNASRVRSIWERALLRYGVWFGHCWGILGCTKDIGDERVVV